MFSKLRRMTARFSTYATYIRERPSWFWVLLAGRFLIVRQAERRLHGDPPRSFAMPVQTRLHADGAEQIIAELVTTGISQRLRLDNADIVAIRDFADHTPCTTRLPPLRSFLPGEIDTINRNRSRDVLAAYYFDAVEQCPAITAIVSDPLLHVIAAAYIGSKPVHIRTRLLWSFPARRVVEADLHASAQEKFHFDLNGFRTLKFFFYITDVDHDSGPHAYVSGSHACRQLKHQLTLLVGQDESELRAHYSKENFRTVTGDAGTGFIEDPFIFHTGLRCIDHPRLLLEIEFGSVLASDSYKYGILG